MIDRASTCLESGGRQLLRVPKKCMRSRRMLHSSFWYNSASDLSLPAWWVPSSDQPGSDVPVDNPRTNHAHLKGQCGHDGELLEFLYPVKTLAFIRRMSSYNWDTIDIQRRTQLGTGGIRRFSSTSRKEYGEDGVTVKESGLASELKQWLRNSSAEDALRKLLESREPGKQLLAWRLYEAIHERERAPALCADLLEYLNKSEAESVDANRSLQIFNALADEHRRTSSYRAAISAYLKLGVIGPAVKLHEEAARRSVGLDFGTNILLGRVIQDNQWELTMRVYLSFMQFWGSEGVDEEIPGLWTVVSALPDLPNNAASLLEYIRQYEHEFPAASDKRMLLNSFLSGFVPTVIESIFSAAEPNENFIRGFFDGLKTQGLSRPLYYELAIQKMLSLPAYQDYLNRHKLFLNLYNEFRDEALLKSDSSFRPSRKLIQSLITQLGRHGSYRIRHHRMTTVPELVEDWRRWYGSLPDHLLYLLMTLYAKAGDAVKVHDCFEELLKQSKRPITLRQLNQLLYVHARRKDVESTFAQFKRISKEFNMVPDITSWNILIYAHVRAEDLDGALSRFKDLLSSKVSPDEYTFGPLLDLSAKRGDVESVESLFSSATSVRVPIHKQVAARASLVLAHINADDMPGAEDAAQTMLADHRAGTLPGSLTSTWNILITHYALRRDVDASRRMYREMVENNILLDTWTYAALMRSLIELKQTNAAYKILKVTMPNNNIRVHAFHYALVITGFVSERQLDRAMHAHKRMTERKVKPSIASRLASLQAIGLTELTKLKAQRKKDPLTRLVEVEQSIREILAENDASDLAIGEPRHSSFLDSAQHSAPSGYFGLLILLYGTRGAYSVCKALFEAVTDRGADQSSLYEAPLSLLTAIMEAHARNGEYEEVEKCWMLARIQANKLTKTWQQATGLPGTWRLKMDSIFDPSTQGNVTAKTIALNRRHILTQPTRIYIRSLLKQKGLSAVKKAQKNISDLLTNGYIIDNITWNEFIQMLAKSGRMIDAFTACEGYLMPNFFGWLPMNPFYKRKELPGYKYMDVRPRDVANKLSIPRYETLVVLAAAYARVKRQEAVGIRQSPQEGDVWASDVLQKIAPKTIHAIETLPQVSNDPLQRKYLVGL
ncbi:hypothetical protein GQ43DRAFT_463300 [Delitschia confertaspora ATCC 74209]|uniref:Pentacotripeptide-repeat region of PRORP domain-containing protein n=1 Tax=Delitschia confertaspora ATCC 74209 TaxID=1513339 RepID=A0A9P4JQI4_9PLEO|nr:hypothetical protein GQ43DRAFT_463300 [Delitschia confertaspora ATCC 74209]